MKSDPYEFDNQTKFKDTPRARHGLPWEASELAELKRLYMLGEDLQHICILMQRPKEGVLPKLANLGLIVKQPRSFFWIWKRKVLPDAWKVDIQTTREEEKLKRYMEGNPARISNTGQDRDTYPYQAAAIDCLDASIFKGASYGIATAPDLSGLELRAVTATQNQTTPKEPIMKFETRVFVNDVDASTLSDDQIFGEIRRAEKRIEELKAIKTPTKKLADSIKKLEEYAADLATYVDKR